MAQSTHPLVSSRDVSGTRVYNPAGDHVGDIDHLMIDKKSGKVAYAVMGFGGFLGLGEEYYLIPWGALSYSTAKGGFVTDITKEQLQGAPALADDWQRDRNWEKSTFDHYGVPYYWI